MGDSDRVCKRKRHMFTIIIDIHFKRKDVIIEDCQMENIWFLGHARLPKTEGLFISHSEVYI